MPKSITVKLTFTEECDGDLYNALARAKTLDRSRILYKLIARGEVTALVHAAQHAEGERVDALLTLIQTAQAECTKLIQLQQASSLREAMDQEPPTEPPPSPKATPKARREKSVATRPSSTGAAATLPSANSFDNLISGCFNIKPNLD
jgi:hypothetical protein